MKAQTIINIMEMEDRIDKMTYEFIMERGWFNVIIKGNVKWD